MTVVTSVMSSVVTGQSVSGIGNRVAAVAIASVSVACMAVTVGNAGVDGADVMSSSIETSRRSRFPVSRREGGCGRVRSL